jgi:hypothetical protein
MKKIIVVSAVIKCNEGVKLRLELSGGFVHCAEEAGLKVTLGLLKGTRWGSLFVGFVAI